MSPAPESRVPYARVLVELGELDEAEREIAEALDDDPSDLTALNLFAKIKHMKGELSQAIACWAQLHARSPHNEITLMCLSALLQIAKDPARGAGEYVALGLQAAQRPAAHAELESAFSLMLAGRADAALAICERVAVKYKSRDRGAYKLAVMAKAWIAELSGELDLACRVLEALGHDRGFETDTDRALSLARVYERIGGREQLEKAVNVFQYLDRSFEKMSAQSRLAALNRKLGDEAKAREYEQRFLESFQARMHRVSLEDVAAVAAERFLPIERLRRVHVVRHSAGALAPAVVASAAARDRATAIEQAVQGDLAAAARGFERGAASLDRKYLANLAALEGRTDDAVRLYVASLSEGGDDPRVIDWLLGAIDPRDHAASRTYFARPAMHERVLGLVEGALRASPFAPNLWRDLGALRRLAGNDAEGQRCVERASAIEEAARRDAHVIGRVLAAAVYHFVGKAKGLIHQIWVERRPVAPGRGGFLHTEDILGNLTHEMRQATRSTFFAVREYARSRFPHQTADVLDYDYSYKVTKEDEPSGGLSAGLPSALAFLSVFLQRPVPQDAAFSGVVIAEAHDVLVVRHVGEIEFKVKAAYNRNLRVLVLPRENRVEVEGNAQVPRAIAAELVRYASNLNDALVHTWGPDVWTS